MSRLFISHSSKNNDWAIRIRDWLVADGWTDIFLDLDPVRGIAAGERWKVALQKAANRCEVVLTLVSKEWLASPWGRAELNAAYLLNKKIIVALVGVAPEDIPPDLAEEQWVDFVNDPNAYVRLKEGLRRSGLDPASFYFPPGRRPYPGFASLEESDAAIFFGRDAQIVRALDKLRGLAGAGIERALFILGASGAGKSSFVRAGLWPRLNRDDQTWLPLSVVRPERAPIAGKFGLAQAVYRAISEESTSAQFERLSLPRSLAGVERFIVEQDDGLAQLLAGLREAARQKSIIDRPTTPHKVVITIDQGEELFTEEAGPEAHRFIQILVHTLGLDANLLAIVAMRTDSFPQVQANPLLAALAKDTFTLDMLQQGSYQAVIAGPAAIANPPVSIDPALTEALLADVSGQNALPLLAFTLAHLYDRHRVGGRLTLAGYIEAHGLKGVIEETVKVAISEGVAKGDLPKDPSAQIHLVRRAFVPHLARVNVAGQFIRRVASRAEIPSDVHPMIDRLVDARLLIKDRRAVGGVEQEVFEVAHEALLREWKDLNTALLQEREFLVAKGQLEQDVIEWKTADSREKTGTFLSGNRLHRAKTWLLSRPEDLTGDERRFIELSNRRASRRQNFLIATGTVALIAIALFSTFALLQWHNASEQAGVAHTQAALAQTNERKAIEQGILVEKQLALASADSIVELAKQGATDAALLLLIRNSILFFDTHIPTKLRSSLAAVNEEAGKRSTWWFSKDTEVSDRASDWMIVDGSASGALMFDGFKMHPKSRMEASDAVSQPRVCLAGASCDPSRRGSLNVTRNRTSAGTDVSFVFSDERAGEKIDVGELLGKLTGRLNYFDTEANVDWVDINSDASLFALSSNRTTFVFDRNKVLLAANHQSRPQRGRFFGRDRLVTQQSTGAFVVISAYSIQVPTQDQNGAAKTAFSDGSVDLLNKGSCAGYNGDLWARTAVLGDGTTIEFAVGTLTGGSSNRELFLVDGAGQRSSIDISAQGFKCVQFSRDWRRMLVLSRAGVKVYDFEKARSTGLVGSAELYEVKDDALTSAFFMGTSWDIVTSDWDHKVVRRRWSNDHYVADPEVIFRGEHTPRYAEPDRDGLNLIIIEDHGHGNVRSFLYSIEEQKETRELGTQYKWAKNAYAESGDVVFALAEGSGILHQPAWTESLSNAMRLLSPSCAPGQEGMYSTSLCWPAGGSSAGAGSTPLTTFGRDTGAANAINESWAELYAYQASSLLIRGEVDNANLLFAQASSKSGSNIELARSDAHIALARRMIRAGRINEADVQFAAAIVRDPSAAGRIVTFTRMEKAARATALNSKAWESFIAGKAADGLVDAEEAVALAPLDLDILDTRGQIYFALDRFEDAWTDLNKVIIGGLSGSGTYYGRGRCYELKGSKERAIDDYKKASSMNATSDYGRDVRNKALERLIALGEK